MIQKLVAQAVVLIIVGAVSLAAYCVGLLIPASIARYQEPIAGDIPLTNILGPGAGGFLWLTAVLLVLWVAYALACLLAIRLSGRSAWIVAGSVSILLVAVGLWIYPIGSEDIWRNIADGRTLWVHSRNPLVTPPSVLRDLDPLIALTRAYAQEPTYYGPLWYLLEAVPTRLAGDGVVANLVAFKALPSLFFLLGLPFVYRLAEHVRPGSGVLGTVVYGWNPLLVWSSAIDGHNDITMAFFVLLSLYFVAKSRWEMAIPMLVLAAIVKYTAVILVPVIVVMAVKSGGRRALFREGVGLLAGLVIAAVIWIPFWDGFETFNSLRLGANRAVNSPVAALTLLLRPSPTLVSVPSSVGLLFTAAFLLIAAANVFQLVRQQESRFEDGVVACIALLFSYLVLRSWWFYPWYVCWLVPLGAVVAQRRAGLLTLIFSASAMAIFPVTGWRLFLIGNSPLAFNIVIATLTFSPPLLYLMASIPPPQRDVATKPSVT